MSENVNDDSVDLGNEQSVINQTLIQQGVEQLKLSHSRSRKVRLKLLAQIDLYFTEIVNELNDDPTLTSKVVDYLPDFKNLIVESTKLCISLSQPSSRISEISKLVYDIGTSTELIVVAVFTWCNKNNWLFGDVVVDLLEALIEVSRDNPDSWLYCLMVTPMVLHIVNAFCDPTHEEFRREWAIRTFEVMKDTSKAVFKCGDFPCQYYLMQVISAWIQWTSGANALALINATFSFVDVKARKQLMTEVDVDLKLRIFLNALNLSKKGPNFVIPINCLYLFVCDTEIRPPEHMLNAGIDFWVDFSIESGRLHTFFSSPGASLLSLNVRSDQIDSVCLNWVVNEGQSESPKVNSDTTGMDTQLTSSTFKKHEKVLFFHIVLNVDFDDISDEVDALRGKGYRSMYFVFRDGELVEKVMQDMGYHQHLCGSKNCRRPRTLRRLLAAQNKLRYTVNWCPESQVHGLDESGSTGSGRRSVTPVRTPRSCSMTKSVTPRRNFRRIPTPRRTLLKTPNSSIASSTGMRETDSAFYFNTQLMSSQEDEDGDISVNGTCCNLMDTFYEDPLPRSARKPLSRIDNYVRNSSPIPEVGKVPFSPEVSAIFGTSFSDWVVNSPDKNQAQKSPVFEDSRTENSSERNQAQTSPVFENSWTENSPRSKEAQTSPVFEDSRTENSPRSNQAQKSPAFEDSRTENSSQRNQTQKSHVFENSWTENSPKKNQAQTSPVFENSWTENSPKKNQAQTNPVFENSWTENSPKTNQAQTGPVFENSSTETSPRSNQAHKSPVFEDSRTENSPRSNQAQTSPVFEDSRTETSPQRNQTQKSPVFEDSRTEDSPQRNQTQKSPVFEDSRTETSPQRNQTQKSPVFEDSRTEDSPQRNQTQKSPVFEDSRTEDSPQSDESGLMSPVFGYSRTLINEPIEKVQPLESTPVSTIQTNDSSNSLINKSVQPPRKSNIITCYANEYQQMQRREKMKRRELGGDYDPYDPLTCTEFEEFRNKMFPKLKTYPGKMKVTAKRRAVKRKRVTFSANNDDMDSDFQRMKLSTKKRTNEPISRALPTQRKYRSFSKNRK